MREFTTPIVEPLLNKGKFEVGIYSRTVGKAEP